MAKALLILDAQNICPTAEGTAPLAPVGQGEYPSLSGREVAEPLLALGQAVAKHRGTVFAARSSGAGIGELCLRGTYGARWNPRLRLPPGTVLVTPSDGGARVLGRTDGRGRNLGELLRRGRFSEVLVGGLTTADEFRDAVAELVAAGIRTAVLADAVFALDAGPGEKPSLLGFAQLGARIVSTGQAIMELYGWRDEYPELMAGAPSPSPPSREARSDEHRTRGWRALLARKAPERRGEPVGPGRGH